MLPFCSFESAKEGEYFRYSRTEDKDYYFVTNHTPELLNLLNSLVPYFSLFTEYLIEKKGYYSLPVGEGRYWLCLFMQITNRKDNRGRPIVDYSGRIYETSKVGSFWHAFLSNSFPFRRDIPFNLKKIPSKEHIFITMFFEMCRNSSEPFSWAIGIPPYEIQECPFLVFDYMIFSKEDEKVIQEKKSGSFLSFLFPQK